MTKQDKVPQVDMMMCHRRQNMVPGRRGTIKIKEWMNKIDDHDDDDDDVDDDDDDDDDDDGGHDDDDDFD